MLLVLNEANEISRPLLRNSERREGGEFSGPACSDKPALELCVGALNFLDFFYLFYQEKRLKKKLENSEK